MQPTIEIRSYLKLVDADLFRLVSGYVSDAKYVVRKTQSPNQTAFSFTLELVPLPKPYHKVYDHLDAATVEQFRPYPALGYSFAAFDGELCVGLAIGEPRAWNKSLWVHELHVAATQQGRGIGRRLVDALVDALVARGQQAGLRTLICETQNTNVPAIGFYLKTGFDLDGVDLTYYTNEDYPDQEIAIFMKKRIPPKAGTS